MARLERITEPGYYHVINRGVQKRDVFLNHSDFEAFLDILDYVKDKFELIIHSYCLMTNHYHVLLQTKQTNISKALQYLNTNYSKYFNNKYKKVGTLWQGRFSSFYLYDDEHMFIVAKYIERNPLVANMVKNINEYKYQSYNAWKFQSKYINLIQNSKIYDMTLDEYTNYISSSINSDILEEIYKSPEIISKDNEVKILYKRLKTFFNKDKNINRNENIKKAYKYGYNKTQIANYLNLSTKTISNVLK